MSVTAMIGDPTSALRKFLDTRLPERHRLTGSWVNHLRAAPRRPIAAQTDRARLGLAFELRVALDLARRPGPWGVLQYLLPVECERLLAAAGFSCSVTDLDTGTTDPLLRGWGRTSNPLAADAQDQRDALATCFLATAMSEIDHKLDHPVEARRWLLQLHRTTIDAEGLTSVDDKTINALIALWDTYLRYGRAVLMGLGSRVIVSPVLVPGFAIPDLVIGRTLVDIKTYQDPSNELEVWLDQVLSYALLDRWNNFGLDGIAIYAGWHAALLRIGFGDLLSVSGVRSHETMDALRRDFNTAMRDDLDEAAFRRLSRQFPPTVPEA